MTLTLTIDELLILLPLLKKNEEHLNVKERQILVKIEKALYEHLSIEEIEGHLSLSPKLC